jgi:hypothetical protein
MKAKFITACGCEQWVDVDNDRAEFVYLPIITHITLMYNEKPWEATTPAPNPRMFRLVRNRYSLVEDGIITPYLIYREEL